MILVTGGTGLVGAHLLLKLTEGMQPVRALYRTPGNIAKTKNLFAHYGKAEFFDAIQWVQGDVTDIPTLEDAFAGVTHVYHCAANVSFDPREEEELRKVNIEGTANMVNCALAFGVQKFCHVSSIAALGDPLLPGGVIDEETDWNPEVRHNDYAISKYGAEMEVWRAWQEGLSVVVVNPGLIFGHGFWDQGSGAVLKAVKRGQYFYTLGRCGIVAVEDVVNSMLLLMEGSYTGERYILVADNPDFKELLDAIASGMHKKGPAMYATKLLTGIGWRADWLLSKLTGKKRMLTRSMAHSSHATETYDNKKMVAATGYTFTPALPYVKALASAFSQQRP
ncbi:NAD-dependent epimerase [Flavobacterium akiainvivens]|uniref:NAD-dependent epimerase n=1 Tax=Flavobacterium akiainvivens TaxID=1202724 RepID=A0A0N0RQS3_9FLAO|nr:NAD-dependent epimerase/dehydratase family protein [Flavobacterium akiainvivens]KOS06656.1 NAD-dependent epimerase [Flavobacterium akiainvivens]